MSSTFMNVACEEYLTSV